MNVHHRRRIVSRWRLVLVVVGAAALVAGSSSAAPSDSGSGLSFHSLTSRRVLDTRNGVGVVTVGPLGAGATIDLVVPDLPVDAAAVAVNVTVANGTEASYLTLWAAGATRPDTSTINWSTTAAVGNAATIELGDADGVSIYNNSGAVDVIIDVLGYYAPGGGGVQGPKGDQGPAGELGATGAAGAAGAAGPAGADGAEGQMGVEGPAGSEGPMGPAGVDGAGAGPVGFVYLSAVNRSAQTIHRGAVAGNAVSFDSVGIAAGGLSMTPGVAGIQVLMDGIYKVSFSVLANEANQLDIRVNGLQPAGALVFAALESVPNTGTVVLSLLGGDVITLENWTSVGTPTNDAPLVVGDVTLATDVGGTAPAPINAWIVVEQLNASPT